VRLGAPPLRHHPTILKEATVAGDDALVGRAAGCVAREAQGFDDIVLTDGSVDRHPRVFGLHLVPH
jgi:hypothetical protein